MTKRVELAADSASLAFRWRSARIPPVAVALAAALTLVVLAPVGYVGGAWDDIHYLEAARCTAAHGFCVPDDHWGRRFPLVAPVGFVLALFGESRQALWVVPLVYSLAAVMLLTATVQRTFGQSAALIAGFLFAVTPVFSERILHLGVDIAEFTFLAAAAFCFRMTVEKRTIVWVLLAGLAASLAVLTRPTSLALLPVIAAAFVLSGQKHRLLPFGLAFAAPLIAEGLCYWIAAGDPFLSWRLSLAHTTIPTDQLAPGVNLAERPFLNVAFIDNWRPASGIEVHWTVDAFLNLVANGAVMVLPVAIALLVFHRRRLGQPEAGGWALLFLVGAAAFYFAALVYGLAIDPKPRMFLPVAAIACVVCGVLGALSLKKGQWVPVFGIAMLIGAHAAISAIARVGGDPFKTAFAPLIM